MATCCNITLYGKYNAWGSQPVAPTAPSILKTNTAVDLGCEVAAPAPPPGPAEFVETLETFVLNFNEFTQYEDVGPEGLPRTSLVTGDNATDLTFTFWGLNDFVSFGGPGDVFSSFPGMERFVYVFTLSSPTPFLYVQIPMNKDLLDPEFDTVRTVQFLHGVTFKHYGISVAFEILDTGEGEDLLATLLPLNSWQQSASFAVSNLDGVKLSNNVIRFSPTGLGVQEIAIDEIEITVGTRTIIS